MAGGAANLVHRDRCAASGHRPLKFQGSAAARARHLGSGSTKSLPDLPSLLAREGYRCVAGMGHRSPRYAKAIAIISRRHLVTPPPSPTEQSRHVRIVSGLITSSSGYVFRSAATVGSVSPGLRCSHGETPLSSRCTQDSTRAVLRPRACLPRTRERAETGPWVPTADIATPGTTGRPHPSP